MSTASTALALPVLDLSKLDDPAGAEEFVDELRAATADYGFFYLVGHGIPIGLQREIIQVARRFFDLPQERKEQIDKINSPHYRGYSRLGGEYTRGEVDWREQIDIGAEREPLTGDAAAEDWATLVGPNQWPEALPEFRTLLDEWSAKLEGVAWRLLRAWLRSLGQREDLLDEAFTPANPLIKVVRYPAQTGEQSDQGVGAHKDGGVLTLLYVEPGKSGLEVEKDGEWVPAPPIDGALIVNIGEMFEVATDGYLKATNHRVVSQPGDGDRISVPYFFNPNFDATFPHWDLPAEYAARASGVSADPLNPIHATYGHNVIKSRVRSHPDVAERHHPHLIGKYNT